MRAFVYIIACSTIRANDASNRRETKILINKTPSAECETLVVPYIQHHARYCFQLTSGRPDERRNDARTVVGFFHRSCDNAIIHTLADPANTFLGCLRLSRSRENNNDNQMHTTKTPDGVDVVYCTAAFSTVTIITKSGLNEKPADNVGKISRLVTSKYVFNKEKIGIRCARSLLLMSV